MCYREICTIADTAGQIAALQGNSVNDIAAAMLTAAQDQGEIEDELPQDLAMLFKAHAQALFAAAATRLDAIARQQAVQALHAAELGV